MQQQRPAEFLSTKAKGLYVTICQYKRLVTDKYSDWTPISITDIQQYTDLYSHVTVRKYIKELVSKGYIEVKQMRPSLPNNIRILRNLDGELI